MDITLKTQAAAAKMKAGSLVIPVTSDLKIPSIVDQIDAALNGQIKHLIKQKHIQTGPNKKTRVFTPPSANVGELLFVGAKDAPKSTDIIQWSKGVFSDLDSHKIDSCCVLLDGLTVENQRQLVKLVAKEAVLSTYRYDATLSEKKPKPTLKKVTLVVATANQKLKQAVKEGQAMAEGMMLTKELGNLPGNVCTPSYMAKEAQKLAKTHKGLTTQVINEPELKKLKMGSLLSVTNGTDEPAKVIIMKYSGAAKTQKPYVLVGKGVTFDSGGISLKPGARMDEMKFDMCGAGSVVGAMHAVASLQLPINVIGVIGAVENMPSGKATKPGDVVTSMSGKTIEVLNTDAEGRLVLCDLLTYVERFKPKAVVDMATLTGACVVALGHHATAIYANDDELSQALLKAGDETVDRGWPMPLWDDYDKQLVSKVADIGNIGGPDGGSVTAACFLARFTEKYDWAHLDIAGAAWQKKMASGRPVSLLTQYLIDQSV